MTMQERLQRLHENTATLAAAFLEPSKDKKGFVCPCGHGSGTARKKDKNEGDGITFTNEGRWHCFSCGHKGDIVDLYQYRHGVEFNTAVKELEALVGILPEEAPPAPKKQEKTAEQVKAEFNSLAFLPLEAEYRGISPETLAHFGAKECKAFSNPLKAGTIKGPRPAIVFPTSEGCYFVRALEPRDGERCDRWDIGGKRPFNLGAIRGGRPVFLVEGVIDALSIIEAGGEAIALSGTGGIDSLAGLLKKSPSPNGFLLAADNDAAGAGANATWKKALEAVGVECEAVDTAKLYAGAKDANEALVKDKDGLKHRIAEIYASKMQIINPWAAGVAGLVERIEAGAYEPIPTGIDSIDRMTGGGFSRQQLVVLTAPPAMGKTSFCQGLVETMARNTPEFTALYFCFEMSREQLQARSISRLMRERGQDMSSLDVMQGKLGWREGVEAYNREIAGKVAYFGLGSGLCSSRLDEVVCVINDGLKYNASTGRPAPFIVIDYLQLIDVDGKEETEAIKATMEKLKEIAVKNDTVVIAIGANNRETNKKGDVSMYGGRGSSSIEYGADIVLALTDTDTLEQEPMRQDRKLSLVMPKGRFYDRNARADFEFKGKYSEFVPVETLGQPVSLKESKATDSLLEFPSAR